MQGATKTINGVAIGYELKEMNVDDLLYYPSNPRIMSELEKLEEEVTQELIDKIMWDRDETHTLYGTLIKDGGLNEALLVYNDEVIEGNTRLCCLKRLSKIDSKKWSKVLCEVIIDEISTLQINRLLIDKHVIGKNDWSAYSKSLLYYRLKYVDNLTIDEINDLVHESTSTIRTRIATIEEYKRSKCEDTRKYSHFEQLVGNSEIKGIIEKEPEMKNKIVEQILSGTIPKAQDVRRIPDIMRNKDAKKRFIKGEEDINDIILDLDQEKKFQNSTIIKSVNDLKSRIKKMNSEDVSCLADNNQDKEDIRQLIFELVKLAGLVNIRLPNKLK
jgi:Cell cycle control protein, G10 family